MYITKDEIVKFIHNNPARTTMKQLYDFGLLQHQTPLIVTKEHLRELIKVDKLVKGSIEPNGTFELTPKGMIYIDALNHKLQEASTNKAVEHTVQVGQGSLENPTPKDTDEKESKIFQIILAILPPLLTHFLPSICSIFKKLIRLFFQVIF